MKLSLKCFLKRIDSQTGFREKVYWLISRVSPRMLIRMRFHQFFHRTINLKHPQDINEKINWLKLHYDLTVPTRCADKYAVRSFVLERGLGHVLNELYGVYDCVDDVDYEKLPCQFVLKTTHGGGCKSVLVVRDKSELDTNAVNVMLRKWLKRSDDFRWYEPQYKHIPHRIIAEKLLVDDNGEGGLVDYKIHCFNGKPYSVFLCSGHYPIEHARFASYDLDWKMHPEHVCERYSTDSVFPKPCYFEQMLEYSAVLSKGFPYVRVDWYNTKDGLVFGELTFTPAGGFMRRYERAYLLELGTQLQIAI